MSSLPPLAERMRPQVLDDLVGQDHLLKEGAPLRLALESGLLPSMILWGPPGVGKTTLANLLATYTKRPFYTLSAISSGVKDVREVISKAESQTMFQSKGAVLFIDEIHRFSKSQQDSLLGAVEKGIVTLIGATTENPSFEVIPALLSRCQVFVLKEHSADSLRTVLQKVLKHDEYLNKLQIEVLEDEALLALSGGDARRLLNQFEILISTFGRDEPMLITNEIVKERSAKRMARYDKNGEQHYDLVSAFIKSIRGSDPNAAVYWLARMIAGGEDPKFIARRLLISAAEDIGLANPNALLMASTCFQAVQVIGFPEARIILSECTIYLASSPKGNGAYLAIDAALDLVNRTGDLQVPMHLRNAPSKLMKELGYGDSYQYAHQFEGNFVDQEFLPDAVIGSSFFVPGSSPKELEIQSKIKQLWKEKYQ